MATFTTTPDNSRLIRGYKWYIVYNELGLEISYVMARGHNEAEAFAKARFGEFSSVCYTEV